MSAEWDSPAIYDPSFHHHLIPEITALHRACVHHDAMLATILDIDNDSKVQAYWQARHEEVIAGRRVMILQMTKNHELAGIVALYMPESETGPFRGVVEKLMVSPKYRGVGIARRMMNKLEDVARVKGRGLLLLDTEIGSDAEQVYPRLGYKVVGTVPRYGISPKDGRLIDEVFFYKDLRDGENQ